MSRATASSSPPIEISLSSVERIGRSPFVAASCLRGVSSRYGARELVWLRFLVLLGCLHGLLDGRCRLEGRDREDPGDASRDLHHPPDDAQRTSQRIQHRIADVGPQLPRRLLRRHPPILARSRPRGEAVQIRKRHRDADPACWATASDLSTGTDPLTAVPWPDAERMTNAPPRASSRSAMLCRPSPRETVLASNPTPSSQTSKARDASRLESLTVAVVAFAYFATFCRASKTEK